MVIARILSSAQSSPSGGMLALSAIECQDRSSVGCCVQAAGVERVSTSCAGQREWARCAPVMKMRPWRSVYLSSGLTVARLMGRLHRGTGDAAGSTQHGASCFDLVRALTNVVQTLVYLPMYVGTCLAICSLV